MNVPSAHNLTESGQPWWWTCPPSARRPCQRGNGHHLETATVSAEASARFFLGQMVGVLLVLRVRAVLGEFLREWEMCKNGTKSMC